MAKKLNFNTLKRPTLPLVMKDEAKTEINVTTPTEGLVEELQAVAPEMQEALQKDDPDMIRAVYDLTARLISCNTSGVTVTAEELRDKYKLNLEDLVVFYDAYGDLLQEINSGKN